MRQVRVSFALFAALSVCVLASDASRGKEASAPPSLTAGNTVQLRRFIGKQVTVRGKVTRTGVSKTGHHFLNFKDSEFTVVCFKRDVRKFGERGPAEIFREGEVEVSGKLELYQRKPQIRLRLPSQIRLVQEEPAEGSDDEEKSTGARSQDGENQADKTKDGKETAATEFELRRIGESTWVSPAGLRYTGRDPEGLTRVQHVLRHAKDQPERAGPHGVFDGDENQALATVDAAWKLAKEKEIKPKQEGDGSAFTIPMGRRIGFLGGQAGATRGNPPLSDVFIVVRAGTSDVVTAFPR